jgi:hypothetical protein
VNTTQTRLAPTILEAINAGCESAQAVRGYLLAKGIDRDTGAISSMCHYMNEQGQIRMNGAGRHTKQYLPNTEGVRKVP